jgi:starch-binding outer membrane protein, SusD/RagB family
MNINKKTTQAVYTALCILLLATVSCQKDILDPTPRTNIAEENAFDTPARVLGQVNGLYDGAKAGQLLGGRFLIYNDIRAEEFINKRTNGVTGLETWNHTLSSDAPEVEGLWAAAYAAINRINIFLKRLDDNAAKIDANLLPQYKAEAKFIRALCYFDLVVLYARPYTSDDGGSPGLPLRLIAETTSANNDLARSSVKETYQQILIDLNEAEANLPATYSTSELNVTRAHKNSVIALRTRVYLSMGKYNEVITEAQKIVSATAPFQSKSGVLHKLETNVATTFTTYTTPESIFSMPMTEGDPPGQQNQLCYYYNKPGVGNGEYSLNSKGILGDTTWKASDARKVNFLSVVGSDTYFKKFNKPAPFTDYVPVLRYAEILLNYAEAAARTGDLPKAIELLTAVRNRSHASYIFPPASIATQSELIKTILTERRIELLGEGFRSIDILRLGQAIPGKSTINPIQPTQSEYIWPIPASELLTNKLMTTNN